MLIGRLNVAAAVVEQVTRVRPYLYTLQGECVYSSISELYNSDISCLRYPQAQAAPLRPPLTGAAPDTALKYSYCCPTEPNP